MPADCPARKARWCYLEKSSNAKFKGRKRPTIIPILNEDIERTKDKNSTFPEAPITSQVSLQNIRTKVKN